MGIMSGVSRSAFDYYYLHPDRDNFFKLSDVNSQFLKRHKIDSSVKDFKQLVKKSKPYTRVITGSYHYNVRHTALYRVSDFKK